MFTTNGMDTLNKYFKVLDAEKFSDSVHFCQPTKQNKCAIIMAEASMLQIIKLRKEMKMMIEKIAHRQNGIARFRSGARGGKK